MARGFHPQVKVLLLLTLAAVLSGCAGVRTSDAPNFREDLFMADPPSSLAIAPFENSSGREGAGTKMRAAIYGALSPLGYEDVELSRVDQAVSEQAVRLNVLPAEVPPGDIASPDLADAVVFGRVSRISRLYLLVYAQYRADVTLAMYSTRTRQQIYTNEFVVRNRRIPFPTSLLGLGKTFLSTLWFLRDSELQELYDEVAEEIAARFPKPPGQVGEKGIYIKAIDVDVARETLRAGDRVVVRVEGAAGRQARFSIGAKVLDQPLRETSPGQYSGMYVVREGDDARYVYVKVRLEDAGEGAIFVEGDASDQAFSIDTQPPVSYAIDTWAELPGQQGIVIGFGPEDRTSPGSEDVPVMFHVFRGPHGGEQLGYLGSARETRYTDADARAGMDYEYAIVAVDAAGNESPVRTKVRIQPKP